MIPPKNASEAQSNRLLSAIPESELALFLPQMRESFFKAGALLQEVGDPIERIYFPKTGMISLLAVMDTGSAVETATIGNEGAVGLMAALIGHSHATGRAVVQLDGLYAHISASSLRAATLQGPTMRGYFSRYVDVQATLVSQVVGCNALHQVSARLCRWLLQTRDRSDSDVLPLTHVFLAEMLGVQRTTVTLLARELQDRGLIAYRRGQITILDRKGLESEACECYETARRKIDDLFTKSRP